MIKKKKFVKSLLDTEVLSLFNIESLLRYLQINASRQVKILMLEDMYIEKLFRKKYIHSCTYGDIARMELDMKDIIFQLMMMLIEEIFLLEFVLRSMMHISIISLRKVKILMKTGLLIDIYSII